MFIVWSKYVHQSSRRATRDFSKLLHFFHALRRFLKQTDAKCEEFFPVHLLGGQVPWCSVWNCLLGKSETEGSSPALAFNFQRNKMFLPRSLENMQYCGGRPWPRGKVLSASDWQCSNYESCVRRVVLSHASHHPLGALLVKFSLYVQKSGLSPIYSFTDVFAPVFAWEEWGLEKRKPSVNASLVACIFALVFIKDIIDRDAL